MAASTQSSVFKNLTYSDDIKNQIVASGGTIIHVKDNIIIASEISEAEYRELLNNPYIDKLDVLPFKRYANEGVTYQQNDNISNIQSNANIENIKNITT
jgi:hypothetical protein